MTLDEHYASAKRDAAQRGLTELETLIDMLQRATVAMRRADWARTDPGPDRPSGPTNDT